jgi:hypothetical protein
VEKVSTKLNHNTLLIARHNKRISERFLGCGWENMDGSLEQHSYVPSNDDLVDFRDTRNFD